MKRVLFFLLAIIFAIQGWTQDVQIGTGTATQGYIPVNAYYGYTYSQQIIKASEISASGTVLTGGTITKIRYYWTGTYNFNNSTQWKVYLGHTTKTSFTSTSDWVIDTSMTVVFDGNITAPTSAGWFTIYLTTPFVYNGTNNLVIAVDENMPSYNLTGAIAYNSYTSTNCGLYYYSDPTNPNPASPPTGTRGSNVPQVKLYFAEACGVASPESPSIITFNPSDATINWALGGLETQWNLQYKLTTDVNWTPIQSITTKPYQLTSLSPNSNYQFQVQSNCGSGVVSGWSDTLSFTTPAIPTQLPFTTNFENATDNSNWQFINGTQVNKWYVGQAIDVLTGLPVDTLGSTKSLYIAGNATGDTNMYLGGSSANVSRVYALRDFFIPSGTAEVSLEFDWRANGNDATTDFLRVYLVPTTATITAGAIPLGGLDASAMIGNYTGGVGQHWLSKKTSWQHAKFRITETQFPLLANNTWRLLVHWRNENTAGTAQPPAAVDNMSINVITCPAPITFATSNPTVNSVDLSWVEKGTATAWNVYYKNINSTVWSMVTATTNPYTLTGLNPSSTYQVKIQASCATDTSYMTGIVNFNTVCAPITAYPWKEGFESTWATAVLPGNDAIPGNCWINVNGGASTSYKWRKSTSISIPAYQRTGTGSAQLYGYNQSMGDYLITPTFTLTGAEKINFYGKGYSTTSNYPENIWVKAYNETLYGAFDSITDTVYFTDLLFINDTNKYTWNEYEIPLTNLVGDYRFVFARNNNVGYYYHIDDLEIDYQGSCPRPTVASVANIQAMQADISWTS
ncbi:MAG: type sorting protein, partial [Bacteroidetes bacterium]|nr:type sorting protein [Bacteroidota bacterium]